MSLIVWHGGRRIRQNIRFYLALPLSSMQFLVCQQRWREFSAGTSFVSYQIDDGRAKQTITDRRNRLGTDTVECIECLHHWLVSGIVAGVSAELVIDESMIIDG